MCQRDADRCTFVGPDGHRCTETERLQFHHKHPHARGGAHSVDNLALMCEPHNLLLAERDYGAEVMARYRKPPGRAREPVSRYRLSSTSTVLGQPRQRLVGWPRHNDHSGGPPQRRKMHDYSLN